MSIEEIEKQCIKLMQKRNSDTKIFETLSEQADEGKKTYTYEGKRYTQKQYDNIYKSLIEYNNNLFNILPEAEQEDQEKRKVIFYYMELTNFLEYDLPQIYTDELSKYECNLLKSIEFLRDIADAEKKVFEEEKNKILLDKIINNDIEEIQKKGVLYTSTIEDEAIKNIQQSEYKKHTFKNQNKDTSFIAKCTFCNLNIKTTLLNLQCIKFITKYFEDKYNIDISYTFPLLSGSPLNITHQQAIEVLKNVTYTVKDIEKTVLYNIMKEHYTEKDVKPGKTIQKTIISMIEQKQQEFDFAFKDNLEEFEKLAYIEMIESTKGV